MSDVCVVFVTCSSMDEAETIAKHLVSQKMAACVNIIPNMNSIYRWEGKVQQAKEILLLIKTQDQSLASLEKAVKEKHSYSCPEVIAMPITSGSKPYLDWVRESISHS